MSLTCIVRATSGIGWFCVALFALQGCGDGGASGPTAVWEIPQCVSVSGTNSIAISSDAGNSLYLPITPPAGTASEGVYFIVPLTGVPNRLLAYYNGLGDGSVVPPALYLSKDAGCSWNRAAVLSERGSQLVAGDGTYAMGWSDTDVNTSIVFVTDADGNLVRTTTFGGSTSGLAASRGDPDLIRRIGNDFSIRESHNRGKSWVHVGTVPSSLVGIFTVAFDANDLNRIAVGGLRGLVTSANGGQTWSTALFDANPSANIVIHSVLFSANGFTIWARGVNSDEASGGNPNDGRHLWQSVDGGLNFTSVAEQGPSIELVNFLIAHPSDPNVVYWSGGLSGNPATHLYQYSKVTGLVTRVELSDGSPFFDVFRFAFNPANPNYMYFGLFWP